MKKIFTSILMLLFAANFALAQTVQFVDKSGNVVANGATIEISEAVVDEAWGDVMIPTGLFVENTTNKKIYVGVDFNVKNLPNGAFQICFPQNCMNISEAGEKKTPEGSMNAKAKKDLQAEWIPDENGFGTCTVELQANIYTYGSSTKTYTLKENGTKITVNMNYKDPASVNGLETDKAKETARYNLAGQRVSKGQKGVNVVKYDNGKTVMKIKN